MRKTEVYSWRLSPDLKAALEEAARVEGSTVAQLLDRIVSRSLLQHDAGDSNSAMQCRIRAAASVTFGTIHGGDPDRSTQVRHRVRAHLAARRRA